jgi:exodeoxyribonuclease V alpha subunit
LGIFNGDVGIVTEAAEGEAGLRVTFRSPDGALRNYHPSRLPDHETAYAMSIHKSQGSEFDEVLVILPDMDVPILTRELIYTAVTRAKKRVSIWCSEEILSKAVSRRIQRSSGLREALSPL